MSDDPAVQAAIEAGDRHHTLTILGGYRCQCGETFEWPEEHDEHVMAVGVEAARPIERATALREAADEIEAIYPADIFGTPSEANAKAALDALRSVGTTPDHFAAAGSRIACNLMRDIAARATVRTEPPSHIHQPGLTGQCLVCGAAVRTEPEQQYPCDHPLHDEEACMERTEPEQ